MALKNFRDYQTPVVDAAWLNAVDVALVTAIGNGTSMPATSAEVLANLGLSVSGGGYEVSIFDYLTTPQKTDVQDRTKGLDLTSAINAAIADVLNYKGTLVFEPGIYRCDGELEIDLSAETLDPTDGQLNRICLKGRGPGSTQIFHQATGAAIKYRGGPVSTSGVHSFFILEDIALMDGVRTSGSIGLQIDNASFFYAKNVDIFAFDYGIDATDVLLAQIMNARLWSHNQGYRFMYGDVSRPNAINLQQVAVAGARVYGGYVEGATAFNIIGGSIEGNGRNSIDLIDTSPGMQNTWGLKAVNCGAEGSTGLVMTGVYIEGNAGRADVWIQQTTQNATHSLSGCTFLRYLKSDQVSPTGNQYTLANVDFTRSGSGAESIVTLIGCGFKSYSPYTPLNTRPYVTGTTGSVAEVGCMFEDPVQVDTGVFRPTQLPSQPTSGLPSARAGGLTYSHTSGSLLVKDASVWRYPQDQNITVISVESSPTLTIFSTRPVVVWTATLTTARNITLSSTGAYQGARFLIRRSGGGLHNLGIYGPSLLATLRVPGQWAECVFDGSNWILLNGVTQHTQVRASDGSGTVRLLEGAETALIFPEEYDALGEYNPASGRFTASEAGFYHISGTIGSASYQFDAGEVFQFRIKVNGSLKASGSRDFFYETATPTATDSCVATTLYLAVGDYVDLIGYTNRVEDANQNLLRADPVYNYFTIDRVA